MASRHSSRKRTQTKGVDGAPVSLPTIRSRSKTTPKTTHPNDSSSSDDEQIPLSQLASNKKSTEEPTGDKAAASNQSIPTPAKKKYTIEAQLTKEVGLGIKFVSVPGGNLTVQELNLQSGEYEKIYGADGAKLLAIGEELIAIDGEPIPPNLPYNKKMEMAKSKKLVCLRRQKRNRKLTLEFVQASDQSTPIISCVDSGSHAENDTGNEFGSGRSGGVSVVGNILSNPAPKPTTLTPAKKRHKKIHPAKSDLSSINLSPARMFGPSLPPPSITEAVESPDQSLPSDNNTPATLYSPTRSDQSNGGIASQSDDITETITAMPTVAAMAFSGGGCVPVASMSSNEGSDAIVNINASDPDALLAATVAAMTLPTATTTSSGMGEGDEGAVQPGDVPVENANASDSVKSIVPIGAALGVPIQHTDGVPIQHTDGVPIQHTNASESVPIQAIQASTVPTDTSEPVPIQASTVLNVSMRIPNFYEVLSTVQHASRLTGMNASELAYKPKAYFSKAEAQEKFGYSQLTLKNDKQRGVPKRIRFYCTKHKEGCMFSVYVSWDQNAYEVKEATTVDRIHMPFCLEHYIINTSISLFLIFLNLLSSLLKRSSTMSAAT